MADTRTIGMLAAQVGVNVETIRYYQRQIELLGIELRLGEYVTPDALGAGGPIYR